VRFVDKESHQIFLEPEGRTCPEVYVQGLSTGLPERLQLAMLRTLPGRGLHSFTSQLNLSRFLRTIHPKHPLIRPDTFKTPPEQPLNAPPIPQNAPMLSRELDESKPLLPGLEQCVMLRPAYAVEYDYLPAHQCGPTLETKKVQGGALHSSTSQLNLSCL